VCAVIAAAQLVSAQFIFRIENVSNPIAADRLPGTGVPDSYWSSYVGVDGGIPSGSVCQTLGTNGLDPDDAQSVTAADVQTAIDACDDQGTQQVVVLETGTYTMNSGITVAGSKVTLRGEGPANTLLIFTDNDSCLGQGAGLCAVGSNLNYYVGEGTDPANSVNWTAGYTKGTTDITLASTPNLAVGRWIVLDQLQDTADTGDIYVCSHQGTDCSDEGGGGSVLGRECGISSACRAQHQWVKVVACSPACGSGSSSTVTIDRPIYMPNWRSGQDPEAYWASTQTLVEYVGFEELSVDQQADTANHGMINFVYAANSWVKHVRMIYAPTPKAFNILFGSSRITIRDSYGFGTADESGSSTHYGVEDYGGNDNLIENNIWDHRTSPFVRDGAMGSVYAYNYAIDNYYDPDGGTPANHPFNQCDQYSHAAGNAMILLEGNTSVCIKGDIVHGSSNLFTVFRNYALGRTESYKTQATVPITMASYNRYWNVVGNVLGVSGYHTAYESGAATAIYNVGTGWNTVPADDVVDTTVMRWWNWDVVTSSSDNGTNDQTGTVCSNAEVPDGISVLPNADPASCSAPNSLYLSAKPSWWGSVIPWPPIGPDVTNGNIANTGGHANKIPAQVCYESMSNDANYSTGSSGGRPRVFDCTYPAP